MNFKKPTEFMRFEDLTIELLYQFHLKIFLVNILS